MPLFWSLDAALKKKGWSRYRLAQETGLTASAIYKLEKKGELTEIDTDTWERLALALEVPLMKLLRHEPRTDHGKP